MSPDEAINFVPTFVLVVFRLSGMMIFAPLFGSTRVPKRVRTLFALVAAMGLVGSVKTPVHMPEGIWQLTVAIGGEMVFGIAMGIIVSLTFVAAQWAGQMVGQQMGFNLAESFDPQFAGGGTIVSEFYFMLTLVVFLAIGGHRSMLMAVHDSLQRVPPLSFGLDRQLFDVVVGMLTSATTLAMRLAAPMFFTMLVVDLSIGVIGKAMPQMNVMSAGLSIRAVVGIIVLLLGIGMSSDVIRGSLEDALEKFSTHWSQPQAT